MPVNWAKLQPGGPLACYAVPYLKDMDPDDLRQVILRLSGRLVPDGLSRDKLWQWAAYLFEDARFKAAGKTPPAKFLANYKVATDPGWPALDNYWQRKSDKAKEAFAKLAAKGPSPTSAMGTAFKILDEGGEIPAIELMRALRKAGKQAGLNSARSYLSCWRRKKKEGEDVKVSGKEADGADDGE